jgi:23S rRNA (pseudouridine1915-N3)-methyltransferase
MRITIIAVGKVREKYLEQGIAEYLKRLRRYATVSIIEVAEEPAPETLSAAEQEQLRARETDRLLKHLKDTQYVIALAIDGKLFTSEAFAAHLQNLAVSARPDVALLIGGSLGLSPAALQRADLQLSFGKFTYPHQLMRLMLVEQVYRAFNIMKGEPYHK